MTRLTVNVVRYLLLSIALAFASLSNADNANTHSLSIEWDNARPEQRQALDNFYRSLEQQQMQNSIDQRVTRQEHLEQLRGMTPEQRQQQMIDFTQQIQQQRQLMLPQQ